MIIVLANQKGGVGKSSTSAVLLGAFQKSLGVDLDTQGNFSFIVRADKKEHKGAYHVLTGECSAQEAIQELEMGDFIAGTPELAQITTLEPDTLSKILKPLEDKYKSIILDTPPVFNAVTINALSAADFLIVPVQANAFSVEGLEQLSEIVQVIRKKSNPKLKIAGLLASRYNERFILHRQMYKLLERGAEKMGTKVFASTIREALAVSESQAMRQDLFEYDPKSKVAEDYRNFISELEEIING